MSFDSSHPVVVHPIRLPELLLRLLEHCPAHTTLVICSAREAFLEDLLAAIQQTVPTSGNETHHDPETDHLASNAHSGLHPLLRPTLSLLAASKNLSLAFCPSVHALQAHLSIYGIKQPLPSPSSSPPEPATQKPILALINPIALHYGTSSFSAQGLSRTFAIAVEAAHRTGRKLMIAECASSASAETTRLREPEGEDVRFEGVEGEQEDAMDEEDVTKDETKESTEVDPWEQHVSILNVTTRSFGAGERGWVGRTVTIRRIAERYCRFEKIDT